MPFTWSAVMNLQEHLWPGNLRELRKALERVLVSAGPPRTDALDLELTAGPGSETSEGPTHLTLKELERYYVLQVLYEEGGHVDRAAKRLDIPRSTLYQKLKTY